jgi:hypothetical protein
MKRRPAKPISRSDFTVYHRRRTRPLFDGSGIGDAAALNQLEDDMTTKTRPVHEIRFGRIRATIWGKSVGGETWYNVTFSRLYKDTEDTWNDTASFGRDDLPLLAKVADLAHTWVYQRGPEPPSPAPENDDE